MTYWLALIFLGCNVPETALESNDAALGWGSDPVETLAVEEDLQPTTPRQPVSAMLTLAEMPSFDTGTTVRIEAEGATTGSAVFFLVGAASAEPECPALLGGLCLSVDLSRGRFVANAVAGGAGTAAANVDVPNSEFVQTMIDRDQTIWMQAVQTSPPAVSAPIPINVCDSGRICEEVITCVGEDLFPSSCGDNDCSLPLGACSSDCSDLPIPNGACTTCVDALCLSVDCDAGFAASVGSTTCEPTEPEAGARCATSFGAEGVWVMRETCRSDNGTTDSYGDSCASWGDWHVCDSSFDDADFTLTEQCCACGGGVRDRFLSCEVPSGACPELIFEDGHSVVEIPFVWDAEPYRARNYRQGYRAAEDALCFTLPENVRSIVASIQTEAEGNYPRFRSFQVGEEIVIGAGTTDAGFDEPYSTLWDTYGPNGTLDIDSFGLPVNAASPDIGGQTLSISPSINRWEADESADLSGAQATLYLAANTTPSEEQTGNLTLNMMIDPSLLEDRVLATSPDEGKLTAEHLDEVIRVASSYTDAFGFDLGVVQALPESLGDEYRTISTYEELREMTKRLPDDSTRESITVFLVETIFLESTSSSYLGLAGALPGTAVGGDVDMPSHGVSVAMDGHRLARAGFCESGFVPDCSGDGDCARRSWLGDGTCDDEAEVYGVDLSCYDEDAGDCGVTTCASGTLADCSGDGDCASRAWLADGVCDGPDEPDGVDLSCYSEDGGDCILTGGLGVIDDVFLASTVAHEIGHYMGLHHTSSREGDKHDPVADTPRCLLDYTTLSADAYFGTVDSPEDTCFYPSLNLMFWADNVMQYYPVSEEQGAVVRAHPLVK